MLSNRINGKSEKQWLTIYEKGKNMINAKCWSGKLNLILSSMLIACIGYTTFAQASKITASGKQNAKGITLELIGSKTQGYNVQLSYNGKSAAQHRNGGEFSVVFENTIHNVSDEITDWKASKAEMLEDGGKKH